MLVNYNVNREDVLAFIEVARSVKDRGLSYSEENALLMENGFYSSLLEHFGSLHSAKEYFTSCLSRYEGERGGITLVIGFIERLINR